MTFPSLRSPRLESLARGRRKAIIVVLALAGMALAWSWWTADRTPELPRLAQFGGPGNGHVAALAVAPDGRTLASGGRFLRLRDLVTGQTRRLQPSPIVSADGATEEPVMLTLALAFSPDGTSLASGDFQGMVRIWDVATATLRHELPAHQNRRVLSVDFSSDGRVLASAGDDRTVRLWDPESGRQDRILSVPREPGSVNLPRPSACLVGFHSDNKTLSFVEYRNQSSIVLWDRVTGSHRVVRDDLEDLWPYRLSACGRLMIAGDPTSVAVWDVLRGQPTLRLTGPHVRSWAGTGSAISSDARKLAVSWISPTRTWLDHLKEPERKLLAQLGLDHGLRHDVCVHDGATGRRDFRLPHQAVAAFSPDGRILVTSDGSGGVVVWDAGSVSH